MKMEVSPATNMKQRWQTTSNLDYDVGTPIWEGLTVMLEPFLPKSKVYARPVRRVGQFEKSSQ